MTTVEAPRTAAAGRRPPHERGSSGARIPLATYRVQFNRGFTFQDAARLAGYLRDLGVSDLYASPYLKASAESTHGYDVADHNALNPAIGGKADYEAFVGALREHGLGQLLDIVPNHMGIAEATNNWWMDVLENGPSSPYATSFDITWEPRQPELRNKVLLPILGDQYGTVLENGELVLAFQDGAFFLRYYDTLLPIAPGTYGQLLQPCLGALAAELEPADERLLELQSILTAVSHLPRRSETDVARIAERQREKEVIKRRLAALVDRSPQVSAAVEATRRLFNGVKGKQASFDRLDTLLGDQAYRLAFWRVAAEEINYRRFFDVNELAAIRVELPEVFRETHRLILRLLREGKVTGLRVDHIDGLWDPAGYLRQLQEAYLNEVVSGLSSLVSGQESDGQELVSRDQRPETRDPSLYVVVEKILNRGEELPSYWPVHGTTGYEFASQVGGLFVDAANRRAFDDLYARFIGHRVDYRDLVNSTKKMIMLVSLASEINSLANLLNAIAERHRRFRDFTLNSLTFAIREVIAALPVYRTYSTCESSVAQPDRAAVEAAVWEAKRRNPRTETSIFDFIRDLLLLRYPTGSDAGDRRAQCQFVMKFQQTTGPVMAKGVEDTAFYVYNRLVSLNEVGGDPARFGLPVVDFHQHNLTRQHHWPHSLLTTSTHDTKRGEDVRARINVLSEIPVEFSAALARWGRWNARHKRPVDDQPAPDRNDEYLIYQTLLGAWPFEAAAGLVASNEFVERIQLYIQKATREAKVHTSWINPNDEYDQAVGEFVRCILDQARSANFLDSFRALQVKVAHFGVFNALAQVLLKLTSPGVPDLYQGAELWDFSLVDPDNRRPVDFALRRRLLDGLRREIGRRRGNLAGLARGLLEKPEDGRVKLFVTHCALEFRQRHPDLFSDGDYQPLAAVGSRAANVCAFARAREADRLVVAVPRLVTHLVAGLDLPLGRYAWGDSWLNLEAEEPGQRYRDVFTGRTLKVVNRDAKSALDLAEIFEAFPLGMLERLSD